jgi:hypothetical protein
MLIKWAFFLSIPQNVAYNQLFRIKMVMKEVENVGLEF